MASKLYAYQQEGAEWLASKRAALLAWQMGTGKTPTAVSACDLVQAQRILVLCPAVARPVWRDAFSQWSQREQHRPVSVLHSAASPVGTQALASTLIVSYDLLSRESNGVAAKLSKLHWDVVICDEGHALKSRTATRTKAVYGKKCDGKSGIAAQAKFVWILTGTPVLNHADELWTHLHALAPELIQYTPGWSMPYLMFTERFCQLQPTPFGNKIVGSRNALDLANRMTPFMSKKRKEDVLKDLPPITFGTVPVSVHDARVDKGLLKEFNEAYAKVAPMVANFDTPDPELFLSQLRGAALALASERRLTGLLKAPVAAELIHNDLKDNDEKMIVFAQHSAVIDTLMYDLAAYAPVKIDGRTSHSERDAAIKSFQNDPTCRIFVGQLQAASTAITLTAASQVLFVEADWTPAINAQAAARAHRIGQKNAVNARFVVLDGTMDAHIMKILARKTADIAEIMDQPATI